MPKTSKKVHQFVQYDADQVTAPLKCPGTVADNDAPAPRAESTGVGVTIDIRPTSAVDGDLMALGP